jgi:hypothetical protein
LSNWAPNKVTGVVSAALLVLLLGIAIYAFQPPPPYPILDPVPPASVSSPESTIETIEVEGLVINSTANCTGMIPHQGPLTFNMVLLMNITNTGNVNISDFHAVKASVYNEENLLFYTFSFHNNNNVSIPSGETVFLFYYNMESRIEPENRYFNFAYARVLVTFDVNTEAVLTTPLLAGPFAVE